MYCNILPYIAIYQPLCRNTLQKFSRTICDMLQYTAIYCNTIYCSICMLYIDWRFIFGSAARAERLFSHCKYIKTETRNRLTIKLLEDIILLKSNRELWKNLQQLISHAISMSKMENFRAYKKNGRRWNRRKENERRQ